MIPPPFLLSLPPVAFLSFQHCVLYSFLTVTQAFLRYFVGFLVFRTLYKNKCGAVSLAPVLPFYLLLTLPAPLWWISSDDSLLKLMCFSLSERLVRLRQPVSCRLCQVSHMLGLDMHTLRLALTCLLLHSLHHQLSNCLFMDFIHTFLWIQLEWNSHYSFSQTRRLQMKHGLYLAIHN